MFLFVALKLSNSVTDFPQESIPAGAEHPLVHAVLLFLREIPFGAFVAHISTSLSPIYTMMDLKLEIIENDTAGLNKYTATF